MHRRRVLAGAAALLLPAGCAASAPPAPVEQSAPPSRYAWFPGGSGLADVYALTWIKGLSPATVVTRVGGRSLGSYRWPAPGWSALPGVKATEAVLAVTRAHGWALMVEASAAPIGAQDDTIGKLSHGTRLVAYAHNAKAADRFVLATDGTILVDFDPGYPPDRAGAQPDLLVTEMRAVGLGPTLADQSFVPPDLATLALTEDVTGVPLTRHLLRDSTYLAAAVDPAAAVKVQTTDDTGQQRPHY